MPRGVYERTATTHSEAQVLQKGYWRLKGQISSLRASLSRLGTSERIDEKLLMNSRTMVISAESYLTQIQQMLELNYKMERGRLAAKKPQAEYLAKIAAENKPYKDATKKAFK